jgi:hypothetical protein
MVDRDFFALLRDETCAHYLDHLAVQDDPREHTRELPTWIAQVTNSVDFTRKMGRDAAAQVAAAVLGISARRIYRAISESQQPP